MRANVKQEDFPRWLVSLFNYNVIGIDVDLRAIKQAKKWSDNKKISFICCDAFHLPFRDKSFDVMLSLSVVEHISNLRSLFLEARRVCKGAWYVLFPNKFIPIDPHTGLFLISWLPRKVAKIYLKMRGKRCRSGSSYKKEWDVHYRTFLEFKRLAEEYFQIIPSQTREPPLDPSQIYQIDKTDRRGITHLFHILKPNIAIDTAALHSVDYCETHKQEAWAVNVEGTRNVAEASKRYDTKMVFISTDYVFDGTKGNYRI